MAALALTLVAVSPALATELNEDHQNTTAAQFLAAHPETADDCEGPPPAEGTVLWHFILNGAPSGETVTLTANFLDGGGNPVAPIMDEGDEADASGTYHFEIITPDDYTLVTANTDVDGNNLNLSHVCIGEPPVIIPEAPASALLVLTAALIGLYFIRRQSLKATPTAA
jgi:protocatechuate 3,4-dioxygenase beta subunit